MIINECCANCGCELARRKFTGISGIYNPGDSDIELCEPCWFEEKDLIDREGNNHPDRLVHYKHMIERYG